MWSSNLVSQCPTCGELTHEFDRHLVGPFYEVRFPVLAYYCPACDHIVIEAYHSKDDRDVVICTHDSDWHVSIPMPLPRPHQAFDPERISKRSELARAGLEFHREFRKQIGPIVRVDDPNIELWIPKPLQFDAETARRTLDGWLRNAKAGAAPRLTDGDSHITIHLVITNEPRFKVQLDRLRRRMPIPDRIKNYRFNEGRRYEARFPF